MGKETKSANKEEDTADSPPAAGAEASEKPAKKSKKKSEKKSDKAPKETPEKNEEEKTESVKAEPKKKKTKAKNGGAESASPPAADPPAKNGDKGKDPESKKEPAESKSKPVTPEQQKTPDAKAKSPDDKPAKKKNKAKKEKAQNDVEADDSKEKSSPNPEPQKAATKPSRQKSPADDDIINIDRVSDSENAKEEPVAASSTPTQPEEQQQKKNTKSKTKKKKKAKSKDEEPHLTDEQYDKLLEMALIFSHVKRTAQKHNDIIGEANNKLSQIEDNVATLQKTLNPTQLIWRITDFKRRFEVARSGQNKVLHSPEIESHRYGYKLALSLCPNGDGKGAGSHMSLFFSLLKGDSDDALPWPFRCRLTFTLLNQHKNRKAAAGKDIVGVFCPNPTSQNLPFLGKPAKFRNPSLGLPLFAPLSDIWQKEDEFVVDDTIFIKVEIDLTDLETMAD